MIKWGLVNITNKDTHLEYKAQSWDELQSELIEQYIHGWFGLGNKAQLIKFLNENTKYVIELGSWYGKSSQFILENCNNCHLCCIDLWDNQDIIDGNQSIKKTHMIKYGKTKINIDQLIKKHPLLQTFLSNVQNYSDRVTAIQATTLDGLDFLYADLPDDINIDLIYIDADHRYQAVKDEIEKCLEYFPKAQLIGDDFTAHRPVKRAVTEMAKTHNLELYNDRNCWILLRK